MTWQLTRGALATIMSGGTIEEPVIQMLGYKKIPDGSSTERYQLLVSDGSYLNKFVVLASHLNDKLTSGELCNYSVIRLDRLCTVVAKKPGREEMYIIIIEELTILAKGTEVGKMMGSPMTMPESISGAAGLPGHKELALKRPPLCGPLANGSMALVPAQPNVSQKEDNASQRPSSGDEQVSASSVSPYKRKSIEQQVSCRIQNISVEMNKKIGQMQYDTANLLEVYEQSFGKMKEAVEESVRKRNGSLLVLRDNLATQSLPYKFLPLTRSLLVENAAFAHLMLKQAQRNRQMIVDTVKSHIDALTQLRLYFNAHIKEVQQKVKKIELERKNMQENNEKYKEELDLSLQKIIEYSTALREGVRNF